MKKTLIALAALAATGAYAQSTVELYGRAEVTTEVGYKQTRTSTTTGVANAAFTNAFPVAVGAFPTAANAALATTGTIKPQLTVQDGNTVGDGSSRFGLRGTEDLGGGLKAVFQFEAGVNIDDGSAGNGGGNLFSRTAMVGLDGGFGRVTAGRQVNPAFSVQAAGQAMGTMNGHLDGAAIVMPNAGGVRSSNSLMYTSPSMSGFTFSGLYAAAEDKGTTTTTTAAVPATVGVVNGAPGVIPAVAAVVNRVNTNNKPGYSLGLNYASGPLYLGFGYDARKTDVTTTNFATGAPVTSAGVKTGQWVLSGAYDLGVIKPFISYTEQKVDQITSAIAAITENGGKEKAWTLGLTAPVGAGLAFAEYGNSKTGSLYNRNVTTGANNLANQTLSGKETAYSVGYRYNLSKRTFAQAAYGNYKQTASITNAGVNTTDTLKRSGLALTLSHAF